MESTSTLSLAPSNEGPPTTQPVLRVLMMLTRPSREAQVGNDDRAVCAEGTGEEHRKACSRRSKGSLMRSIPTDQSHESGCCPPAVSGRRTR